MNLNELRPALGAKKAKYRVGRGIGSGKGKTCGRGHKGQKSRSGGMPAVGFEGGQMPIQRRVPKFGFVSRKSLLREEVRITDLKGMEDSIIDVITLKAAGIIKSSTKHVKLIAGGDADKAFTVKIAATKGARAAIEAAGGKVEA